MITTMFGRFGGFECAVGAPTAPEETAATHNRTPAIERQRISMDVRNS
jgi:hypothetical protein